MVKLAPSLPKEYDDNGLESNTRHLLGIYPKQDYLPIVALVRTKEITQNEHFERVPKVELVHVEIAIDEDDQEALRGLIQRLHDSRVQHVKQPLDLPDVDTDLTVEGPLAIESGEEVIDAEVVDDDAPLTTSTGKDA